jgi:membrane-bound serine protease (ClpP class)
MHTMRWLRLLLPALWLSAAVAGGEGGKTVVVLKVSAAIGPAVSDYVRRSLDLAARRDAELVVLALDTPGGLDDSTRAIVRDIIASPVPVAVYVSPAGARAASAGTYIAYAAHVAAMSPGTNLGAATPVQLGGLPDLGAPEAPEKESGKGKDAAASGKGAKEADEQDELQRDSPADSARTAMERKLVNDSVAYLRSLAQMRGRNAEWAERSVREGASLSAEDALAQNVIDLIAVDLEALLKALEGREVKVREVPRALSLAGAAMETIEPDWRSRLLAIITNPNIAYLLMLLGIYGLFFELANPGSVVPGVIGAVSLLLALYALNVLPVNYAGVALILIGLAFMTGEIFMPSFGALGIGGIVAFVIGSVILFDTELEFFRVSRPVIGGFALLSAFFFLGVAGMAVKVHRRRAVSGVEEMVGSLGVALEDFQGAGNVRAHSEIWRVRSETALKRGQTVRIKALDGLTLIVEATNEEN